MRAKNRLVFWFLAAVGCVVAAVFVIVAGKNALSIREKKRLLERFRDDGNVLVSIEERVPQPLRPAILRLSSPEGLEACDRLKAVHFRFDFDRATLGDSLRKLASIDGVSELILECRKLKDADLSSLPKFADLTTLSIWDQALVDTEILKNVVACRKLQHLEFAGSLVDDDGMALIAQIKKLKSLVLNPGAITDAGLATLGGHPHLEKLHLPLAPITDEGLSTISLSKTLRDLDISSTRITDQGLRHISSLPLRRLAARMTHITDSGVQHLQSLEQLEYLDLSSNRITDLGLSHLKGLPHLESLDLSETAITDAGFDESNTFPKLKKLILRLCDVTDASMSKFARYPALELLDVSGSRISREGVAALRKTHPQFEIVNLTPGDGEE